MRPLLDPGDPEDLPIAVSWSIDEVTRGWWVLEVSGEWEKQRTGCLVVTSRAVWAESRNYLAKQ